MKISVIVLISMLLRVAFAIREAATTADIYFVHKFFVLLQYRDGDAYISFCGGVIIATDWILTAGHCIQSYAKMVVDMGEQQRRIRIIAPELHTSEKLKARFADAFYFLGSSPGKIPTRYDPRDDIALLRSNMTVVRNVKVTVMPIAMAKADLIDRDADLFYAESDGLDTYHVKKRTLKIINCPVKSIDLDIYNILQDGLKQGNLICTEVHPADHRSLKSQIKYGLARHEELIGIYSRSIDPEAENQFRLIYVFTRVQSYLFFIQTYVPALFEKIFNES